MKVTLLLSILIMTLKVYGAPLQPILQEDPHYQGGKSLLQKMLKTGWGAGYDYGIYFREIFKKGGFIELPLDYNDPSKGSFDFFYRVSDHFDPNRPTVFYFMGGPGGTANSLVLHEQIKNLNFVYMDPRGAGFSQFRNYKEMLDGRNFSSEYVAKDADMLRRFLNLDKITVYGASYGTVPATIYGSQFREYTKAVVLEGVVFDGSPELWAPSYRKLFAQKVFDSLSTDQQEKLKKLSKDPRVTSRWFTSLVRSTMMKKNFFKPLKEELVKSLSPSYEEIVKKIPVEANKIENTYSYGAYMYFHIGCKELSFSAKDQNEEFVGNQVQAVDLDFSTTCEQFSDIYKDNQKFYKSTDYPLNVPVTYFQGTYDGATVAPNAMKHMKQVSRGFSQLIYIVGGGHSPLQECLVVGGPCSAQNLQEIAKIFTKAVEGENIEVANLKDLSSENRWVKASKLRSTIPGK